MFSLNLSFVVSFFLFTLTKIDLLFDRQSLCNCLLPDLAFTTQFYLYFWSTLCNYLLLGTIINFKFWFFSHQSLLILHPVKCTFHLFLPCNLVRQTDWQFISGLWAIVWEKSNHNERRVGLSFQICICMIGGKHVTIFLPKPFIMLPQFRVKDR